MRSAALGSLLIVASCGVEPPGEGTVDRADTARSSEPVSVTELEPDPFSARDLEALEREAIWSLGVERFGWPAAGPPEHASHRDVLEWFLEDQRFSDWEDSLGTGYV